MMIYNKIEIWCEKIILTHTAPLNFNSYDLPKTPKKYKKKYTSPNQNILRKLSGTVPLSSTNLLVPKAVYNKPPKYL